MSWHWLVHVLLAIYFYPVLAERAGLLLSFRWKRLPLMLGLGLLSLTVISLHSYLLTWFGAARSKEPNTSSRRRAIVSFFVRIKSEISITRIRNKHGSDSHISRSHHGAHRRTQNKSGTCSKCRGKPPPRRPPHFSSLASACFLLLSSLSSICFCK